MLYLFCVITLVLSNTCYNPIVLEFSAEDTRYSFVQQPNQQQLIDSFPGCGDSSKKVVTWYQIKNGVNKPITISLSASSNLSAKKFYVIHRTSLRVSSQCPTSPLSFYCVAQTESEQKTMNLTFTVPLNGNAYLATYEFLNNVDVQSHLFLQFKTISEEESLCQKADEVIFPLTQMVTVKTFDVINGMRKRGNWHRVGVMKSGERYIIDTCGRKLNKPTSIRIYEDCEGHEINAVTRQCRSGVGSLILFTPSHDYMKTYIFVETEAERYEIHFQKSTKKSVDEACQMAMHIPYIPYTIFSIPFAQFPLLKNPCVDIQEEVSTAFFGVTVHPNHEIIISTCGSPIQTTLSVMEDCHMKCLKLTEKKCVNGKIYRYTPTNKLGHSIVVALSETQSETFGKAKLNFVEKEIGKKVDDELHIATNMDYKTWRTKIRAPYVDKNEILIAQKVNTNGNVKFLTTVIVITVVAAFLLLIAYFYTRPSFTQNEYVPF
ncbi:hypothetical protein EIN_372060 [Entamoeba invadens IP1]|uniref:Uncharacterized protein n=1 Tax=Entamoeba invadens IP1 TaxID=370355 RepID=A0A0A1UFN1_ENTIV|nr:hypothetical protein EIN_372060 [Entamoeba invadens IP1]ELP92784.1 hypothetical protein EIN_372060 [Entamoeba invadens IP1]|eukprot:XP_004259555.1 hypothetical protein EIN_372060 [Entamoeba invadens IP1]